MQTIFKLLAGAALVVTATQAQAASYYNFAFDTEGVGQSIRYSSDYMSSTITTLQNVTINYTLPTTTFLSGTPTGYGAGRAGGGFNYSPTSISFFDTTQWGRYPGLDRVEANACVDYGSVTSTPNLGSFVASCGSAAFNVSDTFFWSANYTGRVLGVTVTLLEGDAGRPATFVNGVPEPATWAMMLVGFGMIGATARYRRRAATVSFA